MFNLSAGCAHIKLIIIFSQTIQQYEYALKYLQPLLQSSDLMTALNALELLSQVFSCTLFRNLALS